jgi:hypothetical protein
MKTYSFKSKVWIYPGTSQSWYFASVPIDISLTLRSFQNKSFGILPIVACVGSTTWKTSLFYSRQGKGYVLPLKKDIRRKEGIQDGDTVSITCKVV